MGGRLDNDSQRRVDHFITTQEPTVARTPVQLLGSKKPRTETIYTRLRNELGHWRPGVDLATTNANMAAWVDRLRALTKAAIEQYR
jgi:hypothetical protein